MAAKIAESAPKTQRSPGVQPEITESDYEWGAPPTQQSPSSEPPESDRDAIEGYIEILKETIEKLEDAI